ncbi:MAG TPA: septum formation protein Maf [Firmicutes bacterium]|nr:septum formation protein Maf [Bacillota bacterium]
MDLPPLILASASPRRRELLCLLALPFRVEPSEAPEPSFAGGDPAEYAMGLARVKALEVLTRRRRPATVLGADTVVVLDGRVFGKPRDAVDAVEMLSALGGRTHHVLTGLALAGPEPGRVETSVVRTAVTFRPLTPERIARYVATGEPFDKAGAYAIQGRGAVLIAGIEGCYFNVVGLPVPTVAELLARRGYPVL